MTKVFIERTLDFKYVVSELEEYKQAYSVEYNTLSLGFNLFGVPMSSIYPSELRTKTCYTTKYKAGEALSSSFWNVKDAIKFIEQLENVELVLNPKLH